MGRPPALDDRQKAEMGRRLALGGDGNTLTELAKEFRVSKATVSRWFSKRIGTVQTLAHTLATTERAIERLPVSEQGSIRTLADQLKGISDGLAEVAAQGVETGKILAGHANRQAQQLGAKPDMEALRLTVALQEGANRSVSTAVGMMQANKDAGKSTGQTLEDLITGAAS